MSFEQVIYQVIQGAARFHKFDERRNGIERMIIDLLDLVGIIDLCETITFYYFRNFAILVISGRLKDTEMAKRDVKGG